MQKSINFFHNENKILSAFDNTFFVKSENGWEEVNNKNVFKGDNDPSNDIGNKGDYYIKYDTINNLLKSSEKFNENGWIANNVSFIEINKKFPYSNCQKMIPNRNDSTHDISYKWLSTKTSQYWCFSIYVSPQEFNDFQIILSDHDETKGVKGIFSRRLVNGKYIFEKKTPITFGNIENDIVEISTDFSIEKENFYRVYLSCKVNFTQDLKIKFSILKNENNVLKEKYINESNGTGLFINAAQLTNTKKPTEYIISNGDTFSYKKFSNLFLKENNWIKLSYYNNVFYGNESPYRTLGNVGDIYFQNPIIELGKIVRFGKNSLFYCWENNENNYYTLSENVEENDIVYIPLSINNNLKYANSIGYVLSKGKDNNGKFINIKLYSDNTEIKIYRNNLNDERFIKIPGVVFWNKEENTYSYINNEGKVCNLEYNSLSLYNPKLVIDALTYSTNLFIETWDSHYTVQPRCFDFGYNTGGHGNFLDYNKLRFYY